MKTRKITYFIGLILIVLGLVLAIPAFLQWIDIIFSGFDNLDSNSINIPDFTKAKSIFTQFVIGGFLIAAGQWLWKIANSSQQNKTMNGNRNIYIDKGNYNEDIRGNYINGNKRD